MNDCNMLHSSKYFSNDSIIISLSKTYSYALPCPSAHHTIEVLKGLKKQKPSSTATFPVKMKDKIKVNFNYPTLCLITFLAVFRVSSALVEITLYEDLNKEGESIFLSINNCTSLPNDWSDRTSSLDIHKSVCIKVFEHSGCKGKYITLRAAHHAGSEYLDNLRDLGFNDVISSVSPCSLQIEDGRYVLQNLGDNKMLTVADEGIYAKVYSKYWRNLNTQHWEVTQVPGSDILYEMLPLMYPNHIEKPVVFDKRDFKTLKEYKKTKPTFLIESVDDWKYAIKEARSKLCLTTGQGKKDEITLSSCYYNSKHQQWIFRVSG